MPKVRTKLNVIPEVDDGARSGKVYPDIQLPRFGYLKKWAFVNDVTEILAHSVTEIGHPLSYKHDPFIKPLSNPKP